MVTDAGYPHIHTASQPRRQPGFQNYIQDTPQDKRSGLKDRQCPEFRTGLNFLLKNYGASKHTADDIIEVDKSIQKLAPVPACGPNGQQTWFMSVLLLHA